MKTIEIKGAKYTVYKDIEKNLEFAMSEKQKSKFEKLIQEYKSIEKIPNQIFVEGIFLHEVTEDPGSEWPSDNIEANKIRFI